MSTITVSMIDTDGVEQVLSGLPSGGSLMAAARDAGVKGILADCGGGCDCGTCHVLVDPDWIARVGAPNELEAGTLDLMVPDHVEGRSRLSCQIELTPQLDGLRVVVATS
ncbi:MAG TPA: 2Fe-2S iron-sulfur cluster-binding protein [Novosphingobium sp.]|nr:2Fe-2S iron-sulfur cluster-binding protein [Novosphingobium sp.]